jgi:nitrite reductase/ring-hydroxylating ferredoxin subunit/hemoglobin-like flavoprotein
MDAPITIQDKINHAALDAGEYFRTMAAFVGFTQAEVEAIRDSRLFIEMHIPEIVAQFYERLLSHPPTRRFFLKPDGSLNTEYIQMRMYHLSNFWSQTAVGNFDDDYARYVDYVGRAHTRRGADPSIQIAEHYVIGQVGFMQQAISDVISQELAAFDPELEKRAHRAWDLLMMVLLALMTRVYNEDESFESNTRLDKVDPHAVHSMAVESYERGLNFTRNIERVEVLIAAEQDIPDESRKLVQTEGLSIGVFHHLGGWYALRNFCQHAGGPVAEGMLDGDQLICPWHGFRYCINDGALINDPSAKLETYPVEVRQGQVYLSVPKAASSRASASEPVIVAQPQPVVISAIPAARLARNEFLPSQIPPGTAKIVFIDDIDVAVYNVDGAFYATADECPHAYGPLHQGALKGKTVTCPWHGSRFDVTTGEVISGPAIKGVKSYRVVIEGDIGKVVE